MTPILSSVVLHGQTDERLVRLARDGHEQAFATIVERYRRALRSYARRLVGESAADDVVQQAMIGAWRALRGGSDVTQLRPWLYRIVRNAALRQLAVGAGEEELSPELHSVESPQGELERRADAGAALAAVAALPERQRQAFVMTALEGRSGLEVADRLGLSENALRQLVHRARTTLRAAASAITPLPLVQWAAMRTTDVSSAPATLEIAGAGAGGAGAIAAKLLVTAAVGGVVIGGASHVAGTGHLRSHRHAARVADSVAPELPAPPPTGLGTPAPAFALAAPLRLVAAPADSGHSQRPRSPAAAGLSAPVRVAVPIAAAPRAAMPVSQPSGSVGADHGPATTGDSQRGGQGAPHSPGDGRDAPARPPAPAGPSHDHGGGRPDPEGPKPGNSGHGGQNDGSPAGSAPPQDGAASASAGHGDHGNPDATGKPAGGGHQGGHEPDAARKGADQPQKDAGSRAGDGAGAGGD